MSFISPLFYTATILALIFFIHKVLWLVQYKRVQTALVIRAVEHLHSGNSQAMREWEEFSRTCWSSIAGDTTIENPVQFVHRVEDALAKFRAEIKASRRSIEGTLVKALSEGRG